MITLDKSYRKKFVAALKRIRPFELEQFEPIMKATRVNAYNVGQHIFSVGSEKQNEYLVLSGIVRSFVCDTEGREVTLNFNVGPSIVDPSITRFSNEKSRQDCVCVTPAIVAHFPTEILVKTMVQFPDIREWGDEVLRENLVRRADREWALAALPAAKRLELFRTQFDDLESLVPHHYIASYLGITPVPLSRLRSNASKTK